ncbi:hypothetical protein SAI_1052 [Streptococcus agalactiae H36B]|nr:hypothetical protein SAI_1052 [Streptococcus agalactiae H36B]
MIHSQFSWAHSQTLSCVKEFLRKVAYQLIAKSCGFTISLFFQSDNNFLSVLLSVV